jgi:hypothetical protein
MKKLAGLVLVLVLGVGAAAQQKPPTDEQLDILGLQADVQKCQVEAAKSIRKLQARIAELEKAAPVEGKSK